MATGQWPTLADMVSRMNGAQKQVYIAEMLSQAICLYDDMPVQESNEIGGHEFVFRTSIPAGAWRQYNMGVPYSKSTTAKARVGLGSLEDYSQIDRMLAEDSGDIEKFREGEDVAFLEGMGQTMEQTGWYGNTTVTPAEFRRPRRTPRTSFQVVAPDRATCRYGSSAGASGPFSGSILAAPRLALRWRTRAIRFPVTILSGTASRPIPPGSGTRWASVRRTGATA